MKQHNRLDPWADAQRRPCKLCGRPIVWVTAFNADSKPVRVPLDMTKPVYRLTDVGNDGTVTAERVEGGGVTHFATCAKVGDLKRKDK